VEKLRILHVCYSLKWGGISIFVRSILKLNNKGSSEHDLLLIADDKGYYDLNVYSKVYNLHYKKKNLLTSVKKASYIFSLYDGIFLHAPHPVVILPLLFRNKSTFIFQHGMTVSYGPFVKRLVKRVWYSLLPVLLRAAVICSTRFAKDKLKKKGIILPKSFFKIVPFGAEIPNEYLSARRAGPTNQLYVGLTGRFVPQKPFFHWC